jgi:aladin
MDAEQVIEQSAHVRNWNKTWIKALAWHRHFPKLAIALKDDSIRVCTVGEEILPMLRSLEQKNVSCVSWRPHIETEIAVGAENGIVLWQMHSSTSIKPGACRTRFLSQPGHSPVTSVEYSSSGLLMLSSSTMDTSIYIWDVSTWDCTPLKRIGGGGVPFACWSPYEDKILTTSPSSVFRYVFII